MCPTPNARCQHLILQATSVDDQDSGLSIIVAPRNSYLPSSNCQKIRIQNYPNRFFSETTKNPFLFFFTDFLQKRNMRRPCRARSPYQTMIISCCSSIIPGSSNKRSKVEILKVVRNKLKRLINLACSNG